jgi:hypothetical protein
MLYEPPQGLLVDAVEDIFVIYHHQQQQQQQQQQSIVSSIPMIAQEWSIVTLSSLCLFILSESCLLLSYV